MLPRTVLREATQSDIEPILELVKDIRNDKFWSYVYPSESELKKYLRAWLESYLGKNKYIKVTVTEQGEVVTFSAWERTVCTSEPSTLKSILDTCTSTCEHTTTREKAGDKIREIRKSRFASLSSVEQLILKILCTRKAYREQGYAKEHLDWEKKHGLVISVLASTMGKLYYERQGFKDQGLDIIRAQEDDTVLEIAAMLWLPSLSQE